MKVTDFIMPVGTVVVGVVLAGFVLNMLRGNAFFKDAVRGFDA